MIAQGVAWLTDEKRSTYGLSLARILLGFIVAFQLVTNLRDRHYTWGVGAEWTDPIRQGSQWPHVLGDAGPLVFDLFYLAAIAAAISLMLGFATRASTLVTLVLWMALYVNHPFVGSGGDAVLRMFLLYACFAELGRHWSLDARLRRRRGEVRAILPSWASNLLHNVALVLIVHQIIMVYVASALWKVQSDVWMSGEAVYYPLLVEAYSPWRDFLGPLVATAPVIAAVTWFSLLIQLFFPLLLLYRPTRIFALVAVTGMHLGIGFLMGILFFSLVMIAVDLLLVSDRTWAEALRRGKIFRDARRARKTETD